MNDSTFDPEAFLGAAINEPMVRRPPLPAGTELIGVIGEVKFTSGTIGKGDRQGQPWYRFDFPIEFDLSSKPDLQASLGVDKLTINEGIMLDIENGQILTGTGKNGRLRQYREALDMNKPGDSFSPRGMQGRLIRAKVRLEPYEGEMFEKVGAVARP
jgi:hypothetical protein